VNGMNRDRSGSADSGVKEPPAFVVTKRSTGASFVKDTLQITSSTLSLTTLCTLCGSRCRQQQHEDGKLHHGEHDCTINGYSQIEDCARRSSKDLARMASPTQEHQVASQHGVGKLHSEWVGKLHSERGDWY